MAGHMTGSHDQCGHQHPPPSYGGEGGYLQQQGQQGQFGAGNQQHFEEPLPQGEVVHIFSEANRNYRLTSRDDGVVLAYKNQQDPKQYWIKVDMGDKFVDQEGCKGFLLVNKATGHALSHGVELGAAVNQEKYRASGVDNSVLWSQGRDEGKGFTTIRLVTNINLNLDADHGDRKHGGIKEGNRLVIHTWNKQENQKWMIATVGADD